MRPAPKTKGFKPRPSMSMKTQRNLLGRKVRRYHSTGDPVADANAERRQVVVILVTVLIALALIAVYFLFRRG